MAAIDTHRPLSHRVPTSPAPQPASENKPTRPPRRRPATSHYRPVSQLLSEESDAPQLHFPKASRRNSVQLFVSLQTSSLLEMVYRSKDKGKEKEKEGRLRKISCYASMGGESKAHVEKERPSLLRHGVVSKSSLGSLRNATGVTPRRSRDDIVIGRTEDAFVEKRGWHRYGGMKLHPYPGDAVYMQSYDPITLENEKYSHLLLRRLTSPLPTFSKTMDRPPSTVLDLGCGQGHWLLDAANFWPNTDFTGFDLVDVMLPEVRERGNVRLVRGNFTKYPLPFPDKSFDFVRMANLSLSIPHDRWSFVISEARRVLRARGQLELIDDELFFPYGPVPVVVPPWDHLSQDSQTPCEPGCSRNTNDNTTLPAPNKSETTGSISTGRTINPRPGSRETNMASYRRSMEYLQLWEDNRQIAEDVEDVFTSMLRKRFVHPSPENFVPDLLRYTFGCGNVSNTETYDIRLAPTSPTPLHQGDSPLNASVDSLPHSDPDSDIEESDRRQSVGSSGSSPTRPEHPLRHSAKAAGRLGISYSDLVAATAETAAARQQVARGKSSYQTQSARGLLQSPGIIVGPSTFIPLSAMETEFHACKWIHTVLASRPAIVNYIRSRMDDFGRRIVDDAELNDALWTYETFRRQRFHWPTNPERDHGSFVSPCISDTHKLDIHQLFEGHDESVHIRTIRVYHATKTETTSLSSLPFSPNTASPSSH